jgi:hypothetical protein
MDILSTQPTIQISDNTDNLKQVSAKEPIKTDETNSKNSDRLRARDDEIKNDNRKEKISTNDYLQLPEVKAMIMELSARDLEVRAHEMAHQMVGGSLAGAMSLSYQLGPDNKLYAIGGEVPISIDTSGSPEEVIANMQQVKAAALSPSSPSGADLQIASTAGKIEMDMKTQLSQEESESNTIEDNITIKKSENEISKEDKPQSTTNQNGNISTTPTS